MNESRQLIAIKDGWTVDCRDVVKWHFKPGQLKVTVSTDHGEFSIVLQGKPAEDAHEVLRSLRPLPIESC